MADVGRPLKFGTVEELQRKIDAYFESCFEEVWHVHTDKDGVESWQPSLDRHGKVITKQVKPFTVAGLCSFLDCDRKTLINYEEKDEYFHTIKSAKTKIEAYVEEMLLSGMPATGPIFNLKVNYGWVDKQEMDLTVGNRQGESFNVSNSVKELTVEELRKLAQSKPDGDHTA